MLCGEGGSVDLTELLSEEIKGPASFYCSNKQGKCFFDEPGMNEVILDVFGDETIQLTCDSSECLYYKEVPGFTPPIKHTNKSLIIAAVVSSVGVLVILAGTLVYVARRTDHAYGPVVLTDDDEGSKLMLGHQPSSLEFKDVSYASGQKVILEGIRGMVRPGELLAIIGASGAGKTTLLDILAAKSKTGLVSGTVTVNGSRVPASEFRKLIGFVDQEDRLMPTLTVYETVLFSALLRLPAEMSAEAKKSRVLETLNELRIIDIKDRKIGEEGKRGISGGEKRRVSIACELVTSPSVLFLDEPTSGLDSYNAANVIECVGSLAETYHRTVVLTIHQPRSNIVSMLDQLVVLGMGKCVYSGPLQSCQDYFSAIGYPCPAGFNLADYIIDLTAEARVPIMPESSDGAGASLSDDYTDDGTQQDAVQSSQAKSNSPNGREERRQRDVDIETLVNSFNSSRESATLDKSINDSVLGADGRNIRSEGPSFGRVGYFAQIGILSSRTFKNLYRNPQLMLTHYAISIVIALLCGFLFYNVPNDISGFQNRLGLLFFILALFGFSTLTSLHVFAGERLTFMRERANGYYPTWVFFLTKVLFDMVPLRVIPPVILGFIVYPLVGFVPSMNEFLKFILVLVLFNLTAAAVCLWIGIVLEDAGVANLTGSLFMLFSLLFAGLLLNRDNMPPSARWLQSISVFHYAFEALLVNEVRYLDLTDHKYGLSIDIPGATILSTFGFNASAYWRDTISLVVFLSVFMCLSLFSLYYFVRERR